MKKKVFFWSPMLSHIGTYQAVISMSEALNKFNNYQVYLINVFGEFDEYENPNIEKINLLSIKRGIFQIREIFQNYFIIQLLLL